MEDEFNSLTDRQKTFCIEYLIDLNATQAARRAGYSEETCKQQGSFTLNNPIVRKYIDHQLELNIGNRRTELKHKVLNELEVLAFEDGEPILNSKGDVVAIRKADQLKALEMLGKYLTLFVDKKEIELKGQTIVYLDKQDSDL